MALAGQRGEDRDRPRSRSALLLAAAASIIIGSFVPFGDILLYPFTLLATWVHEMGHGMTALLVGGHFHQLEIFANAAGLAHTQHASGSADAWVALGGLLAPPIVGAAILGLGRGPRRAQVVLIAISCALLVSLALYVRSVTGFIAVPFLALAIGAWTRWGSPRERMFLAQLLGLRLAADTLGRGLDYLWKDDALVGGVRRTSDIAAVAAGFGGPRVLWSLIVSIACIALVAAGLFAAWREGRQAKERVAARLS